MTNQCDEAFVVKQILDFAAREMCIEERTMQTEEHFLISPGNIV